jgi:hypothetical protein
MQTNVSQASPPVTVSIQGCRNVMADMARPPCSDPPASQESATNFNSANPAFLQSFNSQFTLEQGNSWQLFCVSTKLSSLVFCELRAQPQSLDSWRRLTKGKETLLERLVPILQAPSPGPRRAWIRRSRHHCCVLAGLCRICPTWERRPRAAIWHSNCSSRAACHPRALRTGCKTQPVLQRRRNTKTLESPRTMNRGLSPSRPSASGQTGSARQCPPLVHHPRHQLVRPKSPSRG